MNLAKLFEAFNPTVALELLTRLETVEAELRAVRGALGTVRGKEC